MAQKKKKHVDIKWSITNNRQLEFLRACGLSFYFDNLPGATKPLARVILFGGAAGGGKSDAILIASLMAGIAHPKCNVGIFRRNYPQLEGPGGVIMRSHELFSQLGKWHGGNRRWTIYNGSVIEFNHLSQEADVHNFQSQQFDFIFMDESTQMSPFQLRYMLTRNRATVDGATPFMAMATNPGGVSHGFHRKFFVDAGPPGVPVDVEIEKGRFQRHIFIPSRLSDNKILEDRDPGYRLTLENQPEEVRRALLDGDWDVYSGQYFKTFSRERHVVEPFDLPSHWRKFTSVDWGFAAPCAVLWHAIEPSSGRVYTYRELYVTEHRAAEVADLVKELSGSEQLEYIKMSPDAWHERGLGSKASPGETIAEEFNKLGLNVEPADNRRIIGWQRVREYMADAPDEKPWWQVFNTCTNTIRTLPEMVHDVRKIEDIDGDGEDHCFVAGTLVATENGEQPIEHVHVGEKVWTRYGLQPVTEKHIHTDKQLYRVELSDGTTLTGTANHPVYVEGKGFVNLLDLHYGDKLIGKGVQESALRVRGLCREGTGTVYNVSVANYPEYFANGVLVHNCAESLRYGLMSRPSPVDGSSFLPGAREFYDSNEDEDDDDNISEIAGWYDL